MGGGQGTRATPPRWLLRRLPEPRAPPPGSLPQTRITLSSTPIACIRKINIMDAHERSQGCSGNAHVRYSLHIPLKLYSNHFTYQVYTT